MLVAAGVTLAAGGAQASSEGQVQTLLDRARTQAEQTLDRAGVDMEGRTLTVRFYLDSSGRLKAPTLVRSSGSRTLDIAVESALHDLVVAVPNNMIGAQLTLRVGHRGDALAEN
jgi:outer membrane biosynthesis protein TonB